MKLTDLKGKIHKLRVKRSDYPIRTEAACRSKLQYIIGQKLQEKYPMDVILEDFHCPDGFYLDFFLPARLLAYEIQGEQHAKFTPFFHKSQSDFKESVLRDERKIKFCEINNIILCLIEKEEDFI